MTAPLGLLREWSRLNKAAAALSLTAGGTSSVTVPSDQVWVVQLVRINTATGDAETGSQAGILVSHDGGTTYVRAIFAVCHATGVVGATGIVNAVDENPWLAEPGDTIAYSELDVVSACHISYRAVPLETAQSLGYFPSV